MSLNIANISWGELISHPDFDRLVAGYAAEGGHHELGQAKINAAGYDAIEQSGALLVAGVADDNGGLHGFFIGIDAPLPHFVDKRVLSVDSIYCDNAARHAGAGLKLLRWAKAKAAERGCRALLVGAKVGTRAHRLYERIGRPMNTLFFIEP